MAQLNQIAIGQADMRNAALGGRFNNVRRARPQAQGVNQVSQAHDRGVQVIRAVFDGGH